MGAIHGEHVFTVFFLVFFLVFCVEEGVGALRVTRTKGAK